MKIVADMRGVMFRIEPLPQLQLNCARFYPLQVTSSNYITAHALLETSDRCRTTSSTEFYQTLSFPSLVGKGSRLRDYPIQVFLGYSRLFTDIKCWISLCLLKLTGPSKLLVNLLSVTSLVSYLTKALLNAHHLALDGFLSHFP